MSTVRARNRLRNQVQRLFDLPDMLAAEVMLASRYCWIHENHDTVQNGSDNNDVSDDDDDTPYILWSNEALNTVSEFIFPNIFRPIVP